jgi:hypothetical protein
VDSSGDWLVSSIWFLLSTRLVGIVRWDTTASLAGWSELFSPGSNWVALQLQLFSQLLLQQDGAIQFWILPSVPVISSGINHLPCFGRLACCPRPALSFYVFSDPCWVLVAPLVGWLVALLQLLAFAELDHWEFSAAESWFLAPPLFSGAGSQFHPHLLCRY